MGQAQPLTSEEERTGTLPTISNPQGLIESYDLTSIGRMLSELGFQWIVEQIDQDTQVVVANVYGLQIIFVPDTCGSENAIQCTDLQMLSIFNGRTLSPAIVTRFNNDFVFGYVGLDGTDSFFLRRYDFEETGFTRAHLRQAILSFRIYAEEFFTAFSIEMSEAPILDPSQDQEPAVGLRPDPSTDWADGSVPSPEELGTAGGRRDINALVGLLRKSDARVNQVE